MDDLLKQDKMRTKKLPHFQILLRKAQRGGLISLFYRLLYRLAANRSHIRDFDEMQNRWWFIYRSCLLYYNQCKRADG